MDSIQSKRQKGSLSDRSDTSELCPSGGEESPGIMESPDEQIPESPTDSNDPDDTSVNMPWIKVSTPPYVWVLENELLLMSNAMP